MNYSAIKYCDIANGTGVRTVLFVSGCRNHCKGCFQPETWDFAHGEAFTKEVEDAIMASLEPDYIKGLTLLGGDPMEPENQAVLLPFLERIKKECAGKDIWASRPDRRRYMSYQRYRCDARIDRCACRWSICGRRVQHHVEIQRL